MQTIRDLSGRQSLTQFPLVNSRTLAGVDSAAGSRIQNEPGLGLASLAGPKSGDCLFVGMDLNRKPIVSIQEFDEPGEPFVFRRVFSQ